MIWAFAVTAVVTTLMAPVIISVLRSRNVLDVPNHRSGHTTPTPRGGGVACAIGMGAGALAAQNLGGVDLPVAGLGFVALIAGLGFLDDVMDLSAVLRLVVQLAAGAALGWWFGNLGFIIVGIIVLAWLVNVTNFMDGINGLTAGIAILWGATAWWSGTHFHVPGLAVIGALCAGIGVGFLPWNFPKARIFIGDVGAYLLGTMYAVGIMSSLQRAAFTDAAILSGNQGLRATAIALGPLAIYLADTTVTIIRLVLRGDNPMEAHREYTFHRLVDTQGWPHWFMTSLIVLLSGIVTLAVVWLPDTYAVLVAMLVILFYLVLPALLADNDVRHRKHHPQD